MDLKFKKKVPHTFLIHAVNVGSLNVFRICHICIIMI